MKTLRLGTSEVELLEATGSTGRIGTYSLAGVGGLAMLLVTSAVLLSERAPHELPAKTSSVQAVLQQACVDGTIESTLQAFTLFAYPMTRDGQAPEISVRFSGEKTDQGFSFGLLRTFTEGAAEGMALQERMIVSREGFVEEITWQATPPESEGPDARPIEWTAARTKDDGFSVFGAGGPQRIDNDFVLTDCMLYVLALLGFDKMRETKELVYISPFLPTKKPNQVGTQLLRLTWHLEEALVAAPPGRTLQSDPTECVVLWIGRSSPEGPQTVVRANLQHWGSAFPRRR